MSARPNPGTVPTAREQTALALQLRYGGKEAAHRLGVSYQTHKNHLSRLFARLEVGLAADAAIALGWLTIPAEYIGEDVRP